MKRIAVCISGQSRTANLCSKNIKEFFKDTDEYTVDYFIHTWDENISPMISNNAEPPLVSKYIYNSDIDSYITSYNPKLYKIQPYSEFTNKLRKIGITKEDWDNHAATNVLNLMYSFKQSILLKQLWERRNGFEYDYVVKIRPDIWFYNQSFKEHLKELEDTPGDFLSFFPYGDNWNTDKLEDEWGPDLYWVFRSSKDSNKFSNFFEPYIKLFKKTKKEYYILKHTYNLGLTPIDLNLNKTNIFIVRPYLVPFIFNDSGELKLTEDILKTIELYNWFFVRGGNDEEENFFKRSTFIDLVFASNKLDELQKTPIVEFIKNNPEIKSRIDLEVQYYLRRIKLNRKEKVV